MYAYGKQIDYFDDEHIIAWVREGDKEHKNSGLVVIMSDNAGGSKAINVGQNLANCVLSDITGNMKENVYVDKDGNGIFIVMVEVFLSGLENRLKLYSY